MFHKELQVLKHIVILDDNPDELCDFIVELKIRQFEISIRRNPHGLFNVLTGEKPIDLLILDVMVPGTLVLGDNIVETNGGYTTGILIAKYLRHAGIELPIILFSVAWRKPIIDEIHTFEKKDSNTAYIEKWTMGAEELADFIEELFRRGHVKKGSWKFLKLFGDSLVLKPSFCGMGIDIKKLFNLT